MTAVAVTGMHRSGTSMVARVLRAGGLHLGSDDDLLPPAPDNPEGFFEHAGFVRLDDELLHATGGSWDRVPHLPPRSADDERVAPLRPRAEALVADMAAAGAWGWKDPRTALTARFWLDLLPDVRFVVCLRHPFEVARSLKKRNGTSYLHSLALWQEHYELLLDAIGERPCLVVSYDAVLESPAVESRRLLRFAGLDEADEAATAVIKPDLRHQRLPLPLRDVGASERLVSLYEGLAASAGDASPHEGRLPDIHEDLLDAARALSSVTTAQPHHHHRSTPLELTMRPNAVAQLEGRLDRLETMLHDLRYRSEPVTGRSDQQVVEGCRRMVRDHVPHDAAVAVVAKGDRALLDLYGRACSNFPQDEHGDYLNFAFSSSTSAVAHLEALRAGGASFLLVPVHSAWWLTTFPGFAEHLAGRYQVVTEEPGVGMLIDLREPAADGAMHRTLSAAVDAVAAQAQRDVAVLDDTRLDLASLLPSRTVFRPREWSPSTLPYLDATVDIVVVDDEERLDEARRVAQLAVVQVDGPAAGAATVARLHRVAGAAATVPTAVAVPDLDSEGTTWVGCAAGTAGIPQDSVLVAPGPRELAAVGTEAVLLLEPGVVPVAGSLDRARATLLGDPGVGAVAVKLVQRDGALAAAGAMVFADGSSAGIGAGTYDLEAPWHDFVRDCPAGVGALLVRMTVLADITARRGSLPSPLVCSTETWAAGLRVVYQPEAIAVRTSTATANEPEGATETTALGERPERPEALDAPTWRRLILEDDVQVGAR